MDRWYPNQSVRPAQPPRHLWKHSDEDLFLRRIGFADVVALGSARVVTLYVAFNTPRQLALAFHPEETFYGSLEDDMDDDGELLLPLKPGDDDFQLAVKVIRHLPGSRYLLLLKKKPSKNEKEQPELKWALYTPEKRLLVELRAMFKWLEKKDASPPEEKSPDSEGDMQKDDKSPDSEGDVPEEGK